MDARDRARYLSRMGTPSTAGGPSADGLAALHAAHLWTIPFENLDIHLGRPIRLDEASLVAKVVTARRGGFCYELNGLFAALLQSLGYQVSLLSARVYSDG